MQAGRAAQRVGVPRILPARGQDAGRARGGGHADARAEVAEVPRVLEQDHRRRPGRGQDALGVRAGGAARDRDDLRPGHHRGELVEADLGRREGDVGRELAP